MEEALDLKARNKKNGWLAGGLVAASVYIASLIFFIVYFNEAAGGIYDAASMAFSTMGAVADTFGTVVILALIFFAGILKKKGESVFFVKFFLWAVLITGLYYMMPRLADFYNIVEYSSTITNLQTIHILATMLPQMLFTVSILACILQMGSEKNKAAYTLTWLSFLVAIGMFVVETVYIGYQISAADRALNISYYCMGAFGILTLVFFSAVLHEATKRKDDGLFNV